MSDREFRNKLQERFENYSNQPSDAVWEQLDAHLDERDRKKFIFWWFLGLLATGIVVAFFFLPSKQNDTVTPTPKKQETKQASIPNDEIATETPIEEPNPIEHRTRRKQNTVRIDTIKHEPDLNMPASLKTKASGRRSIPEETSTFELCDFEELPVIFDGPSQNARGFYIKGGTMFNSGKSDLSFDPSSSTFSPYWSPYTADEAFDQERTHKVIFNIEAGYFVHIPISRNFDIQLRAGINYTQTRNQMYSPNTELFIQNKQHSVGVPLTLSARIPIKPFRLNAYLGIINQVEMIKSGIDANSNILMESNALIDGYRFGLQPGIEIGYSIFDNVVLNLSYGYRMNLVNNFKDNPTLFNKYLHVPEVGLQFYLH